MEDRWDKLAREQHTIQGIKDTVTISKAEYEVLIEKAKAYDEEKSLYESEKQLYREAQADAEESKDWKAWEKDWKAWEENWKAWEEYSSQKEGE
ncbi:MAG: hypothetical protein DDT18_00603 [Actinobacteria bacterium]|nr:hypothetical protein [Actinomycetota bacterium]